LVNKFEKRDVFPGDELAVIEEFYIGTGAYQDDGKIRSEELGIVNYDPTEYTLNVEKKTHRLVLLEEGNNVIAEVGSVARRDARVDIFIIEDTLIHPSYSGVIHISDVSKRFIKNIDMALRSGDIVKAHVVNTKNRLNQLSMEGGDYGVIYAYCYRCGTLLEMNKNRLICPKCGRSERRQIADSYGREKII
jgi:exosome complex component CSL4